MKTTTQTATEKYSLGNMNVSLKKNIFRKLWKRYGRYFHFTMALK